MDDTRDIQVEADQIRKREAKADFILEEMERKQNEEFERVERERAFDLDKMALGTTNN